MQREGLPNSLGAVRGRGAILSTRGEARGADFIQSCGRPRPAHWGSRPPEAGLDWRACTADHRRQRPSVPPSHLSAGEAVMCEYRRELLPCLVVEQRARLRAAQCEQLPCNRYFPSSTPNRAATHPSFCLPLPSRSAPSEFKLPSHWQYLL